MNTLNEWRCRQCRRILAKLTYPPGLEIEIKCKCNAVNTMKVADARVVTNNNGR